MLPPVSERLDGFDLFYQRRSLERIYEYEKVGEQFTFFVSNYEEKNVDATEADVSDFDELTTKVLLLFSTYNGTRIWS